MKRYKIRCPECGSRIHEVKHYKTGRTVLVCTDVECAWRTPDIEALALAVSALLNALDEMVEAAGETASALESARKTIKKLNRVRV